MFRQVTDSYIITGSVNLEVGLMGNSSIDTFKWSFSGDDCVKNDSVEEVRIPTSYGLTLLTNVRQRMKQTKCSTSPIMTRPGESVGEAPISELK